MKGTCVFGFGCFLIGIGGLFAQGGTVRVVGQYGTVAYGDYNRFVDSWNRGHDPSVYPRLPRIRTASAMGIEIERRVSLVSLGLGVGYLRLPTIDYRSGETPSGFQPVTEYHHTVSAVPIHVSIRYDLLESLRWNPYVGAAIVYYLTTLTFTEMESGYLTYSTLHTITRWAETEMGADRFGLLGYVGIRIPVLKGLSWDLRLGGRLARIGGWMGTQHWKEEDIGPVQTVTRSETRGVYLVYGDTQDGVSFAPRRDAPYQSGEREGRVDFSGWWIELGMCLDIR